MNRFVLLFFTTVALSVVQSIALAEEQPPINALWNAYNGFGIWIYPESGGCPEIRKRVKSFIVIGPKEKYESEAIKHLDITDLKLCADFYAGAPLAKCNTSSIELQYDKAENQYRGSYNLVLSDGTERKGAFRAAYCDFSQ